MEPQKHLYIDSLRGIAILLVLLVHNRFLGSESSYFSKNVLEIIDAGQFGVQLFFVVSAYTLMSSYYSREGEPFQTRKFFIRRFFRIAPMYYVAILYFTFQNFTGFNYFVSGKHAAQIPLGRLLSNIFFLNGFNPYWINNYVPGGWSIAIEMTFYLSLPFLCRYIKSLNAALLLFAGSLIFSAVLEQILHYTFLHTNEYMFYYFPNQLPVFSLGIVAFFVVRDGVSNLSPGTLAVLAFAAFVFSFTEVSKHISLSLGYFLLLLMLAKKPYKFITNSLFANIGRVSFSMYLVHFAVMHWLAYLHWTNLFAVSGTHSAWLNFAVRYLVLFSLSLGLSVLFYRLVEVPFQRMGKRLIERLNFYPVSSLVEVVLQPEPVYAPNLKKTAPLQFFVSLFKKR